MKRLRFQSPSCIFLCCYRVKLRAYSPFGWVQLRWVSNRGLFPKGRADTTVTLGTGRIRPNNNLEVKFLNCPRRMTDKHGIRIEILKTQDPLNVLGTMGRKKKYFWIGQQGRLLLLRLRMKSPIRNQSCRAVFCMVWEAWFSLPTLSFLVSTYKWYNRYLSLSDLLH